MLVQNTITGRTAVNIAASGEASIASGSAAAGELLPSVRDLAAHLRVSAATVAAAYRLLGERGVVTAERRRGTRIRPAAPVSVPHGEPPPNNGRDLATGNRDPACLPRLPCGPHPPNAEVPDPELVRW